jgi:hypothetical protein
MILTACLITPAVYSAECEFTKNEIDKFTKERRVETVWQKLRAKVGGRHDNDLIQVREVALRGVVSGEQRSILLWLKTSNTSVNFVPDPDLLRWAMLFNQASAFLITLADGSIVTLRGEATVTGNVSVKRDDPFVVTRSTTTVPFSVDAEQFEKLMAQPATRLQAHGVKSRFDIRLGKKSFGHVQKVLGCIQ